jgi:hypothetical protein
MVAALSLPRLFERLEERSVMLSAASLLGCVLLGFTGVLFLSPVKPSTGSPIWSALPATRVILGVGYSAVITPSGRLLRRSAHAADLQPYARLNLRSRTPADC